VWAIPLSGQSSDSLNHNQSLADSTISSLSIFQLIDSLMQLPSTFEARSSLAARIGFNSNILAASRTLGFNQFGLSPGISYYHKSGLYLDATAYWSQDVCHGHQGCQAIYGIKDSQAMESGCRTWTLEHSSNI